ncbi:MAG: undecaprenyl-diphosphate phosphatase [Myxococcaceae bacterium]
MDVSFIQIVVLALIQGAAELLPVSSSAHVIIAERFMGLDPSSPAMTFLLVMLHTGTMFAVLYYFWPRWKKLAFDFYKNIVWATAMTGILGLGLKKLIETVSQGEIEGLFKSLPLMAFSLFCGGILILIAGLKTNTGPESALTTRSSILIGLVQGLCLPFRGFSRSGATISTGMLLKIPRALAEDFSFALAVVLTPPVVALQLYRLLKVSEVFPTSEILPGLLGMVCSFASGLLALRWLSNWLEHGRWKLFGVYCLVASGVVTTLYFLDLFPKLS